MTAVNSPSVSRTSERRSLLSEKQTLLAQSSSPAGERKKSSSQAEAEADVEKMMERRRQAQIEAETLMKKEKERRAAEEKARDHSANVFSNVANFFYFFPGAGD
jgi:hypothetical protein